MPLAPRAALPIAAALVVTSCVADAPREPAVLDLPFAVSDYYAPTGFMGDGTTVGAVDVDPHRCLEPRAEGARGDCYTITYTPIGAWAGVYWQYPTNNWGAKPGKKIRAGATKVTFWAAGAKGGEKVDFRVGGIADETLPNKDPFSAETSAVLTTSWAPYTITLGPRTYDAFIGAFSWSIRLMGAAAEQGPVVFYLDGITWSE